MILGFYKSIIIIIIINTNKLHAWRVGMHQHVRSL